jgi:hypothetical protein
MSQSAFAIIILLSFSKRKGRSALGASDIEIWHGLLPVGYLSNVGRVYSGLRELYREFVNY